MMPNLHGRAPRVRIPNLAPMVDVVMVILIFFMLGTGFATPEGVLPTRLPTQIGPGGGARVSIVPVVRIELRESPGGLRILVMGQALAESSFDVLSSLLTERKDAGADAAGRVLLLAEPAVRFESVISAMDTCQRAGFPNLELVIGGGSTPVRTDES
ncbi:MAG TPA: biopolymer transporter ExbD [Phycisphaerae bacterium]|nr:biopolymer transporter ExbD [Phycisphaerae bacterium]